MRDFKKLMIWQKAHRLTLAVYKATANFPQSELYGLTSQMRRASASIPANIAKGCGRNSATELARFITIAMGSASELEYHLLLAHDLELLGDAMHAQLDQDVNEIKRMLVSFVQKLQN